MNLSINQIGDRGSTSEWFHPPTIFLLLRSFFFLLSRVSPEDWLRHGWLQRSLEGGSTFIKIRHEPSARIRCVLCHAPLISTYIRIYVHVHAARSHLSPSCALQAYDPRGTSECGIHMCVGAKSGENLACVSWIVRGISFRRRTAPFRRRRIGETCAEVPEPIPIARRVAPLLLTMTFLTFP